MLSCDTCGLPLVELELALYHQGDGSRACVTADGAAHATQTPDGPGKCDLCGSDSGITGEITVAPIATSILASEDETTTSLTMNHSEDWACCAACHRDLDNGEFDVITRRAVNKILTERDQEISLELVVEFVTGGVTELHQQVWRGWNGEIRPTLG